MQEINRCESNERKTYLQEKDAKIPNNWNAYGKIV